MISALTGVLQQVDEDRVHVRVGPVTCEALVPASDVPLLQAGVVAPGWLSQDAFIAGYGAVQSVPGPMFTFAGYLGAAMQAGPGGWLGGALAIVAIFLPAGLLVVGVLPFWQRIVAVPNAARDRFRTACTATWGSSAQACTTRSPSERAGSRASCGKCGSSTSPPGSRSASPNRSTPGVPSSFFAMRLALSSCCVWRLRGLPSSSSS